MNSIYDTETTETVETISRQKAEQILVVWKQIQLKHEQQLFKTNRLLQQPTEIELQQMKQQLFDQTGESYDDAMQAFERFNIDVKISDKDRDQF